jgi:hypothetical protein
MLRHQLLTLAMGLLQGVLPAGTTGKTAWRVDPALLELATAEGLRECTLRTLAADGPASLRREMSAPDGPVRVTGLAEDWPALSALQSPQAFRAYPGRLLPRWPSGVRTLGLPVRASAASLGEFIDGMQDPAAGMLLDYVESGSFGAGSDWSPPGPLLDSEAADDEHLMLSIGATGQGYPFHNHGAAWETVVIGHKLVLSFPPGLALAGDLMEALALAPPRQLLSYRSPLRALLENATRMGSAKETLRNMLDTAEISACLLGPGDTVLLPCNTFHATLNIGDTVAVGSMHTNGGACPIEDVHGASAAAAAAARSDRKSVV